jgi:uncharacterized protein YciI
MPVYAVNYRYGENFELLDSFRPAHRAWLKEQEDAGRLLAAGRMTDIPSSLLIWQAESPDELAAVLDEDPFDQAGLIAERDVAEWTQVFGPWVNL